MTEPDIRAGLLANRAAMLRQLVLLAPADKQDEAMQVVRKIETVDALLSTLTSMEVPRDEYAYADAIRPDLLFSRQTGTRNPSPLRV